MAIAQRIKATLGITGWSISRVHIDRLVWHLDVDSSHPGGVGAPKGSAVRRVKWYVSWVKYVVRQYGSYLLMELESDKNITLVREDRVVWTSGIPVMKKNLSRRGSYLVARPQAEVYFRTAGKLRSERITADSVLSGKPILGRFFIRVTVDHSLNRLQV
jgi:hypothetical protein